MALQNFYPELYMKAGSDSFSLTTQELLLAELASNWTRVGACEAGGGMKEEAGQKKEILNGLQVITSNVITGNFVLLEVTLANYAYLRATFHKKACSVLMNQSYAGTTGRTVRAKGVYPVITKEGKSGDTLRVNITFKTESGTASLEEVDMT